MESTKILNGVPTRCLTFDRPPLEHGAGPTSTPRLEYLILVIPGNPGVIEFYRDFMSEIFSFIRQKFSSKSISVMGIAHAGHVKLDMDIPSLNGNKHLYDLNGQIAAKVALLETLPKDVKIIAIGHSIGCKMLLETLKTVSPQILSRVVKCYMLFPTIERMRETPNGQRCRLWLPYFGILYWILYPLMILPRAVQRFLLCIYFLFRMPSECIMNAALELFHGPVNRRMVFLTDSEFEQVVDLDVDTLRRFQDKLFFYFGVTDNWCPLVYVDQMKVKVPTIKHQICQKGLQHAFVVNSSEDMASILIPLIAQDIEQSSA